jgi:hypothetical protein
MSVILTCASGTISLLDKEYSGSMVIPPNCFSDSKTITIIASSACTNGKLTALDLSATQITHIYEGAFSGGISLQSVSFPPTLQSLSSVSFSSTGLLSVTIPASMKSYYASFGSCSSLSSIAVEPGNTVFMAESGCLVRKDYSLLIRAPSNSKFELLQPLLLKIEGIHNNAFSGTSIDLFVCPSSLSFIDGWAFSGLPQLLSVDLRLSPMTSLSGASFYSCPKLKWLFLPSQLQVIGSLAFCSCLMFKIVFLPLTVTTIEENAFLNCVALRDIIFLGSFISESGEIVSNVLKPLIIAHTTPFYASAMFLGVTVVRDFV